MSLVETALKNLKVEGTFRKLQTTSGLVDFSSNDYLGLSFSPSIRSKLMQALECNCPLGATGSRLLSGHTKVHEKVEDFIQQVFAVPSALLFSSGYMANLGVISALSALGAQFFSDEENHASIIDGMRSSRALKTVFRHNDLNDLEAKLAESSSAMKVIVTEGVFSMSGDVAQIQKIIELAKKFNAWIVIDEAHATGVFGKLGLGILPDLISHDTKIISIHTGGKALGGQGAFVLSSREFRELVINTSRSLIFSTALSPLSALQIQFSIEEIIINPSIGNHLLELAAELRQRLSLLGFLTSGRSQIVPIILGSNKKTQNAAQYMQMEGFDVRAIRFPTVKKGNERLRITLKSFISKDVVEGFIDSMARMHR